VTVETCLCFRARGSCTAVPAERKIIELLSRGFGEGQGGVL